jgi:hypothetical protein
LQSIQDGLIAPVPQLQAGFAFREIVTAKVFDGYL